jgi:inhibitor of KinA sporulation pathway (predicted exonuclease)
MNVLSVDLEMNQPSGKIIQIGACAGKIRTGEVIETFSRMVKIDEPITEFITQLTGITQEMNDAGVSLVEAYEDLRKFRRHHKCHKQTIAWGQGDMRVLKEQVKAMLPPGPDTWWDFGIRFFDAKTIFQTLMLANDKSLKAGLAKCLETLGMVFIGNPHDGKDDSVNTFYAFIKMAHMLRGALNPPVVIQIEMPKGPLEYKISRPVEGEQWNDPSKVKV